MESPDSTCQRNIKKGRYYPIISQSPVRAALDPLFDRAGRVRVSLRSSLPTPAATLDPLFDRASKIEVWEGGEEEEGMRGRAAVVVLGDIGRCPRMQYHALSLSKQAGLEVDVVAFSGTEPHVALLEDPNIHLHLMKSPFPAGLPRVLYLLLLPFKVIIQLVTLLWVLLRQIPAPDLYLVQNPPSIPTLMVVKWSCWIRKASFIIDWHNFGYTLLGLNLGSSHPLVKIHFWYEQRYGKMADGYLCVTKAMQHELSQNWGIKATVVYDRSPEFFRPITLQEKHDLLTRLHEQLTRPLGSEDYCREDSADQSGYLDYEHDSISTNGDKSVENGGLVGGDHILPNVDYTILTSHTMVESVEGDLAEIMEGDMYSYRDGRPALIVSSTSWTADEDFSILLEAALMYDRRVSAILGESDSVFEKEANQDKVKPRLSSLFPRLLIIVTGKGPMRSLYEDRIRKLRLRRVAFRTMWVSAEDYPLLLGSADLGVSLHTSSSGLDLPMKVVDMFGCGLPVCAASYSCIGELVLDRQNGLLFSSSSELADQFLDLFRGFPTTSNLLSALKEGALALGSSGRWSDEWAENVLPLIRKGSKKRGRNGR
ncbi:hypothetical protein R1flu_016391 [Riccia fluitans]|uniref:Glycosyltransferase subfamily 4-like N-terminal domain-containing protein n=1 Tax=Riccia fluitans TaxID=41844 RepID=A0ABD1YMJ8_9MARC